MDILVQIKVLWPQIPLRRVPTLRHLKSMGVKKQRLHTVKCLHFLFSTIIKNETSNLIKRSELMNRNLYKEFHLSSIWGASDWSDEIEWFL